MAGDIFLAPGACVPLTILASHHREQKYFSANMDVPVNALRPTLVRALETIEILKQSRKKDGETEN